MHACCNRALSLWVLSPLTAALALLYTPAHAEITVLHPASTLKAGSPLSFTLLLDNPGQHDTTIALPATLKAMVSSADFPVVPLDLQRAANSPETIKLAPGAYRKVAYEAALPANLRGTIRVQLGGFDTAPVLISLGVMPTGKDTQNSAPASITDANPAPQQTTQDDGTPATSATVATPGQQTAASPTLLRAAESRLSAYEPMYFGVGKNGDVTSKFQISFKYRLGLPENPASRSFLDNLYFGFTERSMWNLSEDSHPFEDSSYMPSLFYYVSDTGVKASWYNRLGLETGLRHESNGKAGDDSRSINYAFVRPILHFGDPQKGEWVVAPKLYYYPPGSDNPDMRDYRGFVDLDIIYGTPDGWQLATTLRKGTSSDYGSAELQFTYPLTRLWPAVGGYFFADVFSGYGENMLDYKQHSNIVRFGYSFTRQTW
ncbi:outer membrane phospholipase A [Silvimonas terrae]|uniref:Phospholipase A1 n=1 Tax=Silvimonas terrae TaxID=300266 RepID=A0A840RCK2_9NEIS|nr:phospholipase A [Silvimonas terrae]MBB5190146.1 outer membrane phospholipase A [Silvimonas terrae]